MRESVVEELWQVSRQYADAVKEVDELRGRLYALIREARSEGLSLREIAKASGLTFARIHQITRNTPATPHPATHPSASS